MDPLPGGVTPARSGGPLGSNDAADPDAMVCVAGDTPGPLGSGWDSGDESLSTEPNSCEAEFPVIAVDMERVSKLLYAVAYAEASNNAASLGFWSSEIDLGDMQQVKTTAAMGADRLMDQLVEAMGMGPQAVQDFLADAERRKQNAASRLKAKFDEAQAAGQRSVERWGQVIRFCSNVKFISTVSVKTLGVFTGWGGAGVDIIYTAATDLLSIEDSKGVLAVGLEEGGEEIVGKINELVAEKGIMTAKERNQLQGWLGNYKGNAEKIHKQLDKLENQIAQRLEKGKSASSQTTRRLKKLKALKALRNKTAGKLVRSAGTYKKGLGKAASLAFLAKDVSEAWDQLQTEHAASY